MERHYITRSGRSLTMKERRAMIEEYLTGKYSKSELWRRYTGQQKYNGHILKWMRQYGYIEGEGWPTSKPKALQGVKGGRQPSKGESKLGYIAYPENDPMKQRELNSAPKLIEQIELIATEQDPIARQGYIQELKRKLEDVELKLEAYELMIDIAEKEFKIPIRKKSNTK
jgi:hypothetical protein